MPFHQTLSPPAQGPAVFRVRGAVPERRVLRPVMDIQPAEVPPAEARPTITTDRKNFSGYYSRLFQTSLPLAFGDLLSIYCGIGIGWVVNQLVFGINILGHDRLVAFLPFAVLVHLIVSGCYPMSGVNPALEFQRTVTATIQAFFLIAAFCLAHYEHGMSVAISVFCTVGLPAAVTMICARRFFRKALAKYPWWGFPVVFVGDSERLRSLFQRLADRPWLGYKPIGYVNDSMTTIDKRHEYLTREAPASIDELNFVGEENQSFIAVAESTHYKGQSILGSFPHVYLTTPQQSSTQSLWIRSVELAGVSCQSIQSRLDMPWHKASKRIAEVTMCALAGVVLAPLMLVMYALIRRTSPGPAFYSQRRLGKNGKTFSAWKFRTMVIDADAALLRHLDEDPELREEWNRDRKLKDDPRITFIGNFLRKTSLDELPQLWNILCGDMSLVGPRPIVDAEVEKYANSYTTYSRVKPGLTGLWQISGRNHTTYEERVQLDAYYVMNWSLWLDAYILLRTFKTVAMREGAY